MNCTIGQIPMDGLVANYPFNGNANDESGYGNNGIVSDASLTTDRFGNENCAYYFNGIDNAITVLNNDQIDFSNDEDFSAAFWMKTNQKDWAFILNKQFAGYWNGYLFEINNEDIGYCTEKDHILFYTASGALEDACSDNVVNNDDWVFITGVYNSNNNTIKLYVNGNLQSDVGRVSGEINSAQNLQIGYGNSNEYGLIYFQGKIDDIRIYNRTLNDQEITALYNENNLSLYSITVGSVSTITISDTVEVPIITSELYTADNIISYQFNLTYDNSVLEYITCDVTGTIAAGGTVFVNSETARRLVVGYLNSVAITGSGPIATLKFRVIGEGYSPITISDFLYNADTVTHITNGYVSTLLLGDVDANGSVQAYDAALTLQYSVGLDPLPSLDPLPWETWRLTAANVDGESGITAYDASLILQKTVGLIESFPIEGTVKYGLTESADIIVKVEGQNIVFYPVGSVYSLNIFADNSGQLLGKPVLSTNDALSACNDTDNRFAFGVATANAFSKDKALIKIPFNMKGIVTLNLMINANFKTIVLDLGKDLGNEGSSIFPNPATDHLQIYNTLIPAKIDIFGLDGDLIKSYVTNSTLTIINIADLSEGMYILRLQTNEGFKTSRIIKQ